jgi:hypothetical protein
LPTIRGRAWVHVPDIDQALCFGLGVAGTEYKQESRENVRFDIHGRVFTKRLLQATGLITLIRQ